ncbi:MAG: flavodoxin-dependent (E)-4-hydroxy-3-methylbut-2-enyl-diphosphate synthase [Deltaproteobacteria bacterium]|nr:flavodoxin-dependent (E)-4-hydroxy-3-methylbut-2-enyl-diphosphate synthase [Deltaproteobacteria bacterium]MDH3382871.1 flavodoxin-dependent (E)-4-hydroxy-3-methylbut-2-enyl-diphosphate synthase [Deltaproteobacteria bacterium]
MKPGRKTRRIRVGTVSVGGGAPVSVQSMTKTDTGNVRATVAQIRSLAREGCEIVRVAVPDEAAVRAFRRIKSSSPIPVIADVHFNHRIAIACAEAGADGLRINPGNIGGERKTLEVLRAARSRRIPVRIGVNAGSLEKDLLAKHGGPTPRALLESAARAARLCEKVRFTQVKFSLKASDVPSTVEAYRLFAKKFDYPLHVGVTEAGSLFSGTVRSSVGLGILLAEGIGDTLRVSITGPPEEEVRVGWQILKTLGIRKRGPEFLSCPTCGRVSIDVAGIATEVERRLSRLPVPLTVAVMGCAVNGPGEAREADVGVAGGRGEGLIFVRGKIVKKVKEKDIVAEVVRFAERLAADRRRTR